MLRLRKNKILPQQVSDLGAFIFVVTMIPTTYIWEVSKPKLELCFRAEAEGLGQSDPNFYFQVAVVSRSIFAQDGYYWYIHMVLGVVSDVIFDI